ncbi:hypothetical protein LCGC14_2508810 [marine sediment metagenome]|uniref:Uncharacterized protein n=1 Tax=marine sediment metagenome TaxID=412755 RepID=A0A0F9BMM5_9ZZZZ
MINFKEIADFIAAEIKGCKFVGIADDGETFVEFEHDIENLKLRGSTNKRKVFQCF